MNWCINCMEEIRDHDSRCAYCGSIVGQYEQNARALQPLSVLNGKYLTGKILGEGGFGITYLGLDLNLKHKVAIKEYFPIQCATRNTIDSNNTDISVIGGAMSRIYQKGYDDFVKEARRLSSLENMPGIVHVMNFFYENNTAYMVMEYVNGVTLKDELKEKNRIGWKKTLELIQPVIKSLSVVHKNGIIHRDISPDNIMLDKDGNMTLIDFGAAREDTNDGKSKTVVLKHGYAPPEQYQTHGNQGTWTDVYGICATIYRMIAGEKLPDAMALYTGSAHAKPINDADRSIPANIEAAIFKGINPRVDGRIRNMEELSDYLYQGKKVVPTAKIKKATIIMGTLIAVLIIGAAVSAIADRFSKNAGGAATGEVSTISSEEDVGENATDAGAEESVVVQNTDTAAQYVKDNNLSYTADYLITTNQTEGGIVVTGTDYSVTDIILPETVNGEKVVAISGIGNNVISLVLPDTLTSIEANAFKNCVYLESVFIPAGVSNIGDNAFENCASLSEIYISEDNQTYHVENGKIIAKDGTIVN